MKNGIWNTFEKTLGKMASVRQNLRRNYLKGKDDGLGRELVGADRFGNTYYQYFSYHGIPTRRIVLYNFNKDNNKFEQDPHFLGWLRRNEQIAPTPETLEQLYIEHDAFVERGIEWDNE
jgi:NADH:ubiquinone oxidoreductase subunit